jgi:hypothetical protein
MNPENEHGNAWTALRARGGDRLPPGFADRVLREARDRVLSTPGPMSQFVLGAATAALCFLAVEVAAARNSRAAAEGNLADWQQIASASAEFAQAQ